LLLEAVAGWGGQRERGGASAVRRRAAQIWSPAVADIIAGAPGVDGGDDLLAVVADRGRAEIGVAELALDHVERDAFASELDARIVGLAPAGVN
jgi:hypothetical protein